MARTFKEAERSTHMSKLFQTLLNLYIYIRAPCAVTNFQKFDRNKTNFEVTRAPAFDILFLGNF